MTELQMKNAILKGLRDAGKMAIKVALRTGTNLVTWENGKVKEVKPTKRMLKSV